MDEKEIIIGIRQYSYKSEESFYKSRDWSWLSLLSLAKQIIYRYAMLSLFFLSQKRSFFSKKRKIRLSC